MRLIRLLIFSFSMLRDGYSEDDGVMPTEKSRALMLDHFWLGGPGVQQNNFRCYRCRSIHRGAGIGGRPTPQVLTYVNGGWTSTRFSGVNFPPSGAVALPAQTFSGGFIGGGAEFAVATVPGLYWRNEYRLSSYRPTDLQFSVSGMPIDFMDHQSATVQTITTSVIWKFH
jgi:hypothetical protein